MYWEKNVETIKRAKLEDLQLGRLKDTIGRMKKSYYYGKVFKEKKLGISSLRKLKDIQKFPFTTKDDLREHWPYGFIAVPKGRIGADAFVFGNYRKSHGGVSYYK